MAPIQRKPIAKDRFSSLFSTLKTQTYHDPSSRSHAVRTIAFNPTGHLLATGSSDRTLRIWNPEKPQVKNSTELRGHTGPIERVAWNPIKEAELVSVSTDGTARFWDVRSKSCRGVVKLPSDGLTVAWSADGGTVVVGTRDDELVPITVPEEGEPLVEGPILKQDRQTNQLLFPYAPTDSPPKLVLLTTGDGSVKVASWPPPTSSDVSNGTFSPALHTLHLLHAHTSACLSLALSPTGRYLAVGGSDALISLWDTQEWVCRRTLTGMMGQVKTVGFSWDGSYVAGGSEDGTGIEIAHVETGEIVHTIPTTAPAPCVAWHPSRYWIAYSGDQGGLKIVGAAGGSL